MYRVEIGRTKGDKGPVSFLPIVKDVTKREAVAAVRRAQAGKHCHITKVGHTYYLVPRAEY